MGFSSFFLINPAQIFLSQLSTAITSLVAQVTDSNIVFVTGEDGRETAELVTTLNTWKKDRRFVVSRMLKEEKDSGQ